MKRKCYEQITFLEIRQLDVANLFTKLT